MSTPAKRPAKAPPPARAKAKPAPRRDVQPDPDDTPASDSGDERIVSRPDGYHWLAADGRQEFGPYETIEEARAEMNASADDLDTTAGETLFEAESEIGIADWIDPDTGDPAEGQSPPHLVDE